MSHSGTSENSSHWLARPALNCWLPLLSPSNPSALAPAHSKPSSSQRDLLPGWWQQQPHRDGASNLPSSARQGPGRTSGLHPWVASTLRVFSSPLGCQPAPPGPSATADKTKRKHTHVCNQEHMKMDHLLLGQARRRRRGRFMEQRQGMNPVKCPLMARSSPQPRGGLGLGTGHSGQHHQPYLQPCGNSKSRSELGCSECTWQGVGSNEDRVI